MNETVKKKIKIAFSMCQRLFLFFLNLKCYKEWHTEVKVTLSLQCVAVCCSVLQCVAVCCSVLQCAVVCCSVLQCVAVCCSVLPCVAVCCSVLQSVCQSHILVLTLADIYICCVWNQRYICKEWDREVKVAFSLWYRLTYALSFGINFTVARNGTQQSKSLSCCDRNWPVFVLFCFALLCCVQFEFEMLHRHRKEFGSQSRSLVATRTDILCFWSVLYSSFWCMIGLFLCIVGCFFVCDGALF